MELIHQTDHADLPDGRVTLLGAADSVTPACTLVEVDGARVLVDCGADPGRGPVELPAAALEADAVVLTHGHLDHVGGLPELLASGFGGPIVATPATLAVARLLLADGVRLRGGGDADARALRAGLDHLARPTAYDEPLRPLPRHGLELTLREAGHILGSASVELVSPASRVILSGDLGRPGSPLLRDYHTGWSAERPVDLVVLETTYGDREHEHGFGELADALLAIIERALEDGGHILVPAFAIGRTQTLLYLLDSLVESGRLSGLPVALDTPLGLRVTETYGRFAGLYDEEALDKLSRGDDPLDFAGLYAVRKGRDSYRLDEVERPLLIIAGSGMCTGGRIVHHLVELLPRPETDILFVGYQAHGTPGRAILEIARERDSAAAPGGAVVLGGQEVEVNAHVHVLDGLSAHADRGELAAWLDAIPGVGRVLLHHGEPQAQAAFAAWYGERG